MRKKIFKMFLFIWLFIWLISNIFAFDANLQLDKSETNINDNINLRVEINSTKWWQIWITNIKWLENFDLISKSQSQSSSTSVIVINWKTQNKTKSTINLDLTLKPKSKWEFVLWPAILEAGSWKILTNTVKIKVWWDNLFINNNVSNSTNQKQINNLWQQRESKIETYNKVEKRSFDNSRDLYLLLIILLFTWIGFYILNNNKFKGFIKKSELAKGTKWADKENEELDNNEVNFEKVEKIEYPEVNDSDFISKVDNVLRNKLELKFNIKNINSKTYDELLKEIWENKWLENLIKLINNAKYSNNIWNNNKILELLKEI
jgi:hypothetical protein